MTTPTSHIPQSATLEKERRSPVLLLAPGETFDQRLARMSREIRDEVAGTTTRVLIGQTTLGDQGRGRGQAARPVEVEIYREYNHRGHPTGNIFHRYVATGDWSTAMRTASDESRDKVGPRFTLPNAAQARESTSPPDVITQVSPDPNDYDAAAVMVDLRARRAAKRRPIEWAYVPCGATVIKVRRPSPA